MKKSTICIFLVVSILFYVVLAVAIIKSFSVNPEKYEDYKVYDYHLTALSTSTNVSKGTKIEKDGNVFSVKYRKITNHLDDQFVLTIKTGGLFQTNMYFIMQNPDNYVDVFQEWSIRKIEIYKEKEASSQPNVITTTYDANVFTEFLGFIKDKDQKTEFVPQEGFEEEYLKTNYLYIWNSILSGN